MAAKRALPRYFLLKSPLNNKYLRHVDEFHGKSDLLVCDGEDISSNRLLFAAERSKSKKGYFHIRCCYNNKFWTFDDDGYVLCGANNPVEDTSKGHWTLLEVIPYQFSPGTFFFNIRCELRKVVHVDDNPTSNLPLALTDQFRTESDSYKQFIRDFIAVDWETFVRLPRRVTFKGDNGKYLKVAGDRQELAFTADNRYHCDSIFDIVTNPDGTIRLKNGEKYWYDWGWISCNTDQDKATLFEPIFVAKNVIALRVSNKHFCRRERDYSVSRFRDFLCSSFATTICTEARLEIEEPVSYRKVSNVQYREENSRFYDESTLIVAKACVINDTSSKQEVALNLSHEFRTTHTWITGQTWVSNVNTGFGFDIPSIANAKFEHSTTEEKNHQWGKQTESTVKWTKTETVPVDPGKKVEVTVVASRCTCDVPFSYTVFDRFDDGNSESREYEDGIYTGTSYLNFKTNVAEV